MPVANSYYKILLGINDAKNSLRTPTNRVLNIESPENLRFLAANYGTNITCLFVKYNVPDYRKADILVNTLKSISFWVRNLLTTKRCAAATSIETANGLTSIEA